MKKQTHFLLVFSTINIGFYPQKHCNRQRHHNEDKANHFHNNFTNFSCYVLFRYCFPKIWHISFYAGSSPKFNFRGHLTIKRVEFGFLNVESFGFWQVAYTVPVFFCLRFCFCLWNFWCSVFLTLELTIHQHPCIANWKCKFRDFCFNLTWNSLWPHYLDSK